MWHAKKRTPIVGHPLFLSLIVFFSVTVSTFPLSLRPESHTSPYLTTEEALWALAHYKNLPRPSCFLLALLTPLSKPPSFLFTLYFWTLLSCSSACTLVLVPPIFYRATRGTFTKC